ncbi:MAG: hypothetical protein KME14_26045 [Tildeniella torsiva UHER 1998/13D]|jgi:leucyl-tRNA synthetase|nr:hypothetical protein [Tildeniella torsiva UHER 1998/13D]
MDITAQKQRYEELQAARTELIDAAVAEIASHLEGLDPDVCKEILAKLHRKLTGESMPKQVTSNADWAKQREASTQDTLKATGEWIKAQSREDAAKATEHRAMIPPARDPIMDSLDKQGIIEGAMGLWK